MNTERTPAQKAVSAARIKASAEHSELMRPHVLAAIDFGCDLDRKIAALLNRKGLRTRVGARWTAASVSRLRQALDIPKAKSAKRSEAHY